MTFKQNTGILAAVLLVMVLLFGSTLAVAKGRGGDPTVCQGESGRAFGLCNAYCEAMDCDWDLDAPEDDCADVKANYQRLTGEEELPCEQMSLACVSGDTDAVPSSPFDVGDGNDYGGRELGFTVPTQCECDGNDCGWDTMALIKTKTTGKDVWFPKARPWDLSVCTRKETIPPPQTISGDL